MLLFQTFSARPIFNPFLTQSDSQAITVRFFLNVYFHFEIITKRFFPTVDLAVLLP